MTKEELEKKVTRFRFKRSYECEEPMTKEEFEKKVAEKVAELEKQVSLRDRRESETGLRWEDWRRTTG